MRKTIALWWCLVAVLVLGVAGLAVAGSNTFAGGYQETAVALTGTDPSGATEGIDMTGVTGLRVIVSAGSGQTITGGNVKCWYRSDKLARWMPCKTATVALTTGVRDSITYDTPFYVTQGRVRFVPSAVTLSAGTTVTVTYEVNQK